LYFRPTSIVNKNSAAIEPSTFGRPYLDGLSPGLR